MQRRSVEAPPGIPLGVAHVPYGELWRSARDLSAIEDRPPHNHTSLAVRTSLYTIHNRSASKIQFCPHSSLYTPHSSLVSRHLIPRSLSLSL